MTTIIKTNEELISEFNELSARSSKLFKEHKFDERNKLVEPLRYLATIIDWGYKVGEVVERRTGRGWETDRILAIENDRFTFRTIHISHHLIRKPQHELVQLSIFD